MDPIQHVVTRILSSQIKDSHSDVIPILQSLWPLVTGTAMAAHTRPVSYQRGVLKLEVNSVSWNLELHNMVGEIRGAVNSFFDHNLVQKVTFDFRPFPQIRQTVPSPATPARPPRELPPVADEPDPSALDPELRGLFRRSMRKYFARNEWS